ncbi:MAG: hypothetical protein CVV47_13185 [Spirochaetae bacterium HGW-Spirochaetae-3]|jgi:DNA-binding PadR family transcriptional regulator|nr:MAG: hypothetical protein CVV47_13185 [Spirochaetae bacterium HGW-Spirochaetae-3]
MDKKNGGSISRHYSDIRPEFVPLGFLVEEPTHGYEVYRRFSDSLAGLWRISESQMYATLKRLEERGCLDGSPPEKGTAASRRVLSPSAAGLEMFAAWLEGPTVCSPRILRLEFLTRLFFARRLAPDSVAALAESQRASVAGALERLSANRTAHGDGFDVFDLALAFSESQLRSALEWIESSVSPALGPGGR